MTRFVALLRGINVSGQKPIRMDALKSSCEALGLRDVATYLQSGNVIFSAPPAQAKKLPALIKARIVQDFGHDVEVLVWPEKELKRLADANPLWPKSGGNENLFHATFLAQPVSEKDFRNLKLPIQSGERAVLAGSAVFLHCPNGYGKTKLSNRYFEKALGVSATTRNWRTVLALKEMCAQQPNAKTNDD